MTSFLLEYALITFSLVPFKATEKFLTCLEASFEHENQFLKRFIIECSQLWSEMNSPNEFQTFLLANNFSSSLIYCILQFLLAAFSEKSRFLLRMFFSEYWKIYSNFRHRGHCRHSLIKKICVRCIENSIFLLFLFYPRWIQLTVSLKVFFYSIMERKSENDVKRLNKGKSRLFFSCSSLKFCWIDLFFNESCRWASKTF